MKRHHQWLYEPLKIPPAHKRYLHPGRGSSVRKLQRLAREFHGLKLTGRPKKVRFFGWVGDDERSVMRVRVQELHPTKGWRYV